MISVVCWLWSQPDRPFVQYRTEHVNRLYEQVARWYPDLHRFICVTNQPEGLAWEVEVIHDREDFQHLPSPHGRGNPSCYRRLRLFAADAAETFGARIVSIDLDVAIIGDLRPLWNRAEPFVMWQDPLYPHQLCGSMLMLTAGAHTQVWDAFDADTSPRVAAASGYRGSDQAWISYCLADKAARWTAADGVLSWRKDLDRGGRDLPAGARIVMYHGRHKPSYSS